MNVDPVPVVTDDPTDQYTLSGRPPLVMIMVVPVDVTTVVGATKIHTPVVFWDPYPDSVKPPELRLKDSAPEGLYTPGGRVTPDNSGLIGVEDWLFNELKVAVFAVIVAAHPELGCDPAPAVKIVYPGAAVMGGLPVMAPAPPTSP